MMLPFSRQETVDNLPELDSHDFGARVRLQPKAEGCLACLRRRIMQRNGILLINDGSFLLRMVARRLENNGYQTWVTDPPQQALEMLDNCDFDLVVMKLSEEDPGQLAVLNQVKELCPEAQLVIISDSEFLPIEFFEADFDDYISVPCSPNKLWRRLAVFLEEPLANEQQGLLLHPANYRAMHRLVTNLQEIHQNLRDGEARLLRLQEKMAGHHSIDLAANLKDVHQKNNQSIFLVEKILTNFTGHDFSQEQVDCYDI
jgi:DNA-binding response OmpR family regulator